MKCQNTTPTQHGFTALELIIVLIIGFSIIGLSASKMAEMMDSSKATRALDSIVNLFTAIKSLETPEGHQGSLIPRLIDVDLIPKSLKIDSSVTPAKVTNQWNKPVGVDADDPQNPHKFTVSYHGVPKLACVKLVKDLFVNYSIELEDAQNNSATITKNDTLQHIVDSCKNAPPTTLKLTEWE